MTSTVTERMGKVRHNSLNQSDCRLPSGPLAPTITPLYEAALHSRVCTHTHTQTKAQHPTLSQTVTKREDGRSSAPHLQLHQCILNYARIRECVLQLTTWLCVYVSVCVFFQARAHDCSCPLAPLSKPAPLLVVGERSHGVAFLSV